MAVKDHDIVDVEVLVLNETEKAILVTVTGSKRDGAWIPRSQIEIGEIEPVSNLAMIQIPEWLALDRRLI